MTDPHWQMNMVLWQDIHVSEVLDKTVILTASVE